MTNSDYISFCKETDLNATVLFLLSLPRAELTNKMREHLEYLEGQDAGAAVTRNFFKSYFRGEILAWMQKNRKIDIDIREG